MIAIVHLNMNIDMVGTDEHTAVNFDREGVRDVFVFSQGDIFCLVLICQSHRGLAARNGALSTVVVSWPRVRLGLKQGVALNASDISQSLKGEGCAIDSDSVRPDGTTWGPSGEPRFDIDVLDSWLGACGYLIKSEPVVSGVEDYSCAGGRGKRKG